VQGRVFQSIGILGKIINMARVSKNNSSKETEVLLIDQMTEVIGRISQTQATGFIFEFLGKEEKIMLAKRLAAITMIHEGGSSYAISNILHISPSTVVKLYDRYNRGDFSNTIKALTKNKKDYRELLETIDFILRAGLPRYNDKNRWQFLRKL